MGISEQSTLLCEQKIVIQSSDFPVRRTGSYRHKKSTGCRNDDMIQLGQLRSQSLFQFVQISYAYSVHFLLQPSYAVINWIQILRISGHS